MVTLAGGNVVAGQPTAGSIVPPCRSAIGGGPGRIPFHFEFFRRAVAIVRVARRDQPLGHRPMPLEALGLKVRGVRSANERSFVPVEAQPSQAVENTFHHF